MTSIILLSLVITVLFAWKNSKVDNFHQFLNMGNRATHNFATKVEKEGIVKSLSEIITERSSDTETWTKTKFLVYIDVDREDYYNLSKEAIDSWNDLTILDLKETNNKGEADITITNVYTNDEKFKKLLGENKNTMDGLTGNITLSEITIFDYNLISELDNGEYDKTRNTIMHELGHAFGLHHTEQGSGSVMDPINAEHPISVDDANLINSMYAKYLFK